MATTLPFLSPLDLFESLTIDIHFYGKLDSTLYEDVRLRSERQSVDILPRTVHHVEIRRNMLMVLIEIQTGIYLGEDDAIRDEDICACV